ncbi:hypothetical protein ACFQY5_39460 [Paeniroseomonas aquatica]|uniref:hypothetical protein n=1 Tax=Paeniroseomonas aquatica TaxID=373043 RepID=UPI003611070D
MQQKPVFAVFQPRVGIDRQDAPQRLAELPAEVALPREALPELVTQRRPRHGLRLADRHPVQPLGEPAVGVERQRRVRQRPDRGSGEGTAWLWMLAK